MNTKYKNILFSDLIVLLLKNDNKDVLEEIYNRLSFCGFEEKTISYIISYEKKIVQKREREISFPIYKNFFWKNKNSSRKIFDNDTEKYCLRPDFSPNEYTLLTSELICIYNEAYYICNISNYKYSDLVYDEAYEISEYEDSGSWVIGEFYNRLENFYRFANKISNNYKGLYAKKNIYAFYDNELNILFQTRWSQYLDPKNPWESYSNKYLDWIDY